VNIGHSFKDVSTEKGQNFYLSLLMEAQLVTIGGATEINKESITSLSFALTNFSFDLWDFENSFFNLEVSDTKVKVVKRINYDEQLNTMLATKAPTVTAFFIIEVKNKEFSEIVEIADNLCYLFSFAMGTKVSWIYYNYLNETGVGLLTSHFRTMVMNYDTFPVIDLNSQNSLIDFIENSYHKFVQTQAEYGLKDIIDVLTQAKSGGLPKLAALNVSSAIDALRATWAEKNNWSYMFDDTDFSKFIREPIKKEIRKGFKGAEIPETKRAEIYKKLSELNRPTFKTVLKEMIKTVKGAIQIKTDPQAEEDEIDRFVNRRDNLVHQGKFLTSNVLSELYEIFSIADRIILALLEYKGLYYNAGTGISIDIGQTNLSQPLSESKAEQVEKPPQIA